MAACGGEGSEDDPVPTEDAGTVEAPESPLAQIEVGPTILSAWPDRLVLLHGQDERLTITAGDFQLGLVGAVDPKLNYDPYHLEPTADLQFEPDGLGWVTGTKLALRSNRSDEITLDLALSDGRTATLRLTVGPGGPRLHWSPPPAGPPAVFFRVTARVDATEGFYGLGEYFDRVEHRGTLRAMHFEPTGLESGYNEAHVPVPLLVGTRGWGMFFESYRLGVFRVAIESDDEVTTTFGLGPAGPDGLLVHLFTAEHPLDITRAYYEVTGYPGPIAQWALGPWLWRDEVTGQAAVEADLETIRDLDLATTGYWIDRPYASAVNSFDFDAGSYDDPAAMIEKAHALGFEMALWHTPYVDPDDEDSKPLYDHALEQGYFPPVLGPVLANWGPPIDLTNPDAYAWWQSNLKAYIDLGITGFKLDYAEEVIAGAFGSRLEWQFADGSDDLTMHRRYQQLYHRVYADLLPETGGFLLCRAGVYGDQVNGTIIWPGDIDANMAYHGEKVDPPEGSSYNAVGGLPAAVIAGSSLGVSGYPWFAADTGGYRNAPPDMETYQRWIQQSALSPVMQVGTNTNDLPWAFGDDEAKDEGLIALYRKYARLHLRLFPYLWTLGTRLNKDGRAIQRPFGLAYPELGLHPNDVYLLGDHLLVAPIVRPALVQRDVPLPPGEWVDWWTGSRYEAARATIQAPLDRIPLLVRAGAPIPLLRPTIDTIRPVPIGSTVDSLATAANPLHVRVTPGPAQGSTLYDGSVIAQEPIEGGLRVSLTGGTLFDDGLVVELFGVPEPSSVVDVTGSEPGWTWSDERGGTATITLTGPSASVDVLVELP